ncbi:peptidoglycan glycosyltransferase [Candidatus Moduliflexus flocculans]|uniref:Peptidoglycan glycosyltransferase n=1 Tax=Candidatus Moduliflexus flocculans TaxID=1499966 RepID=A0A0S6VUK5_9BACT|nr:peptidoglycan glycosyltransferase [Candidatus Moduliflexus flocculans]
MAVTKKLRRRILIIFIGLLLVQVGLVARLTQLQVLEHAKYLNFAQEQSKGNLLTLPVRGKIFDRNLFTLAESIDTKSVVMRTSQATANSAPLQRVSTLLDIPSNKLNAASDESSRLTYLKRKLTPEELTSVQSLLAEDDMRNAGIFLVPDTKRFYPQRRLASHILGFTGLDEYGYDNQGLEGLEYHYNSYLRGNADRYSVKMDAKRNSLNSWDLDIKNSGYDLVLTIDKNIQYMVERELEATFRAERARHATVIVMNPHTGEILAMVNYPDYNPNEFSRFPQEYYKNRAVAWDYEPGSTFKIVQASAAIDEGILSPQDRYDNNNGFLRADSKTPEEWKASKLMSVEDILVQSNNLGAMKISAQLGSQRFYDYIRAFGFGSATGIDLPGEITGKLREPREWSNISLQSLSIGQEISVTPLQITNAFAVLANGGILYRPYIVKEIRTADGVPVQRIEPMKIRRVISRKTAQIMREILSNVVERGTGKRAAASGYRVAGKTGTAQKFNVSAGGYSSTRLVTSFVGFAPAEYPAVVISAIVDEPAENEWGGTVAAPLFKRIAERVLPYLDIPSDLKANEFMARKE